MLEKTVQFENWRKLAGKTQKVSQTLVHTIHELLIWHLGAEIEFPS